LIALSREAQRLLPVEEKAIRSVNELNVGYAYLAMSDLQAARLAFEKALEDGVSGRNFYAAIYGPINLILSALLVGRRREALQLCEANIDRFNRILAGQSFPPMGALYILKGSILLEHDQVAEAEKLLTDGLELIRWTGESLAHRTGYQSLARARAIQGDQAGMLEALKTLAETLPKDALYVQALHHRLSLRYRPDDRQVQTQAQIWLFGSGIEFGELEMISSLNPASTAQLETYLNAVHVLSALVKATPGAFSLDAAQVDAYLERQTQFAEAHGLVGWLVEIAIARVQLYEAVGKRSEALQTLDVAVRAAAPTGLFRVFVDECETLGPLLEALRPRLKEPSLVAYAGRLSEAFGAGAARPETEAKREGLLSARELEVLQNLARGLSYEEIGQQLFLSLNTIQSHVKSIYRKLLVNKRVHAIEKARDLKLI
jgi:ATP/maltotriose-dependent transcriptional regulator MalT